MDRGPNWVLTPLKSASKICTSSFVPPSKIFVWGAYNCEFKIHGRSCECQITLWKSGRWGWVSKTGLWKSSTRALDRVSKTALWKNATLPLVEYLKQSCERVLRRLWEGTENNRSATRALGWVSQITLQKSATRALGECLKPPCKRVLRGLWGEY